MFKLIACLCLLLTLQFVVVGNAQEVDDAAVQSVISDLAEVETKMATLNVAIQFRSSSRCLNEQLSNNPEARLYFEDEAVKVRIESKGLWEMGLNGSRRFKVTSEKTNILLDESQVHREELVISTFDRKRGAGWLFIRSTLPDGKIKEQEKGGSTFIDSQYSGHDLISEWASSSVSEKLSKGKATLIGEEVLKGQTILVLKTLPRETAMKTEMYFEAWVAPERSVVVRQRVYGRSGGQNRWELISQIDCDGIEYEKTFDICQTQLRISQFSRVAGLIAIG